MKAFQAHLNTWLLGYVVLAMLLGLLIGRPTVAWTQSHQSLVSTLTTVAVFLIVYPMMVTLKLEALVQAGKNLRGLSLSVLYNFLWAPLVGVGLTWLFFPHEPLLALGFLLVMVVPCSSMAIGYTGLAKGHVGLATAIVALSFVLAVGAVPLWMTLFAAQEQVPVPIGDMLLSIVTVLLAPMVVGFLTRLGLVRWLGKPRFQRWQPLFPALSLLSMFGIVFLIFFGKAGLILDKWQTVLLLLAPNAIFIALTLAVVTWLNHRLGLSYEEHMAVVFASTGKNNGTAIAMATMAFSPLVAIPAATMPIFQILFLVVYLKLAEPVRRSFRKPQPAVAAVSPPPSEGGAEQKIVMGTKASSSAAWSDSRGSLT
jgi:ACR3 family arsenite transporter